MSNQLIQIPFQGFYESIHDEAINSVVENMFSDDTGEAEVPDGFWQIFNGKAVREAFSQLYVETLRDKLVEEFEDISKVDFSSMEFDSIESPREYNFETDRIFVRMPESAVETLWNETSQSKLANKIKEECSNRSGFISHYSPDIDDWREIPIEHWDHNQLGILFSSFTDDLQIDLLSHDKQEEISNLVYENMGERCQHIIDNLEALRDSSLEDHGFTA